MSLSDKPMIHYSQVDYIMDLAEEVGADFKRKDVELLTFEEYLNIKEFLEYIQNQKRLFDSIKEVKY